MLHKKLLVSFTAALIYMMHTAFKGHRSKHNSWHWPFTHLFRISLYWCQVKSGNYTDKPNPWALLHLDHQVYVWHALTSMITSGYHKANNSQQPLSSARQRHNAVCYQCSSSTRIASTKLLEFYPNYRSMWSAMTIWWLPHRIHNVKQSRMREGRVSGARAQHTPIYIYAYVTH